LKINTAYVVTTLNIFDLNLIHTQWNTYDHCNPTHWNTKSGFTLADSKNLWDNIDLSWEEEGFGPWGVILKAEEKLVGYCGLHFSDEYSEIELRYALHAEYWNQGYTFEAAQKALELGFDVFQFPTIISYTLPENIASRRIMEKLGMKQEKEFEHKGLKHVWYRV